MQGPVAEYGGKPCRTFPSLLSYAPDVKVRALEGSLPVEFPLSKDTELKDETWKDFETEKLLSKP